MINKKVILLAPFKSYHSCYKNGLLKYTEIESTIGAEEHYYKPLQKIFSKVISYGYSERLHKIGLTEGNEEIIELVKKEHPDYVIWIPVNYTIRELTLDSIRKQGAKLIGFFWDDEYHFDDYSKWWIPYFDYCVTNTLEAVPKYRELKAKCIFLGPIAGGVAVDRNWSNLKEKYNISFVGNRNYTDRKQYLDALQEKNMPVHIFGGENGKGFISIEEMLDVYASSKINLNFSKFAKAELNKFQLKGRIFEVCMAGGFLLTEYTPGIENYFDIDKEIVCFRDSEEMIDKTIYYLRHEKERRAIAQAGWKRAVNNYTSFHVLSKLFKEIEKQSSFLPHPVKKKMPRRVRKSFSDHYFTWGLRFALENNKKLWKDALSLSLSYDSFNIRTWYCYLIGFSPCFIKPCLLKTYKILNNIVVKCLTLIKQ